MRATRSEPSRAIITLLVGLGLAIPATLLGEPAKPQTRVDLARDIYPILQRACLECHGPELQKGKLRLDVRDSVFKRAIVPGKAEESELLRRITLPKGDRDVMPVRGQQLTKSETDLIRDWINQGAVWPDNFRAGKHWAYVKPVRPPLPAVKNAAWPRNPIDAFILARLEREGLSPSPEAERATLIRRVSLDLIGLPPTLAEVDTFLADTSPNAYEKLVDRLLASPHFGERWARPWLDLARYADSHGFQRDDLRELWAYRDWVIRALNADTPFDQFSIEQLAGDLLPNATLEQKIATGFHRCTPINVEAGSEPEESRVNQVFDRVNTTAAVWLGSTLECAQCHDHKYDSFSQKDYYQLFAFFNNTAVEADRTNPKVPGSIRFLGPNLTLADRGDPAERGKLQSALQQLQKEVAKWRKALTADLDQWAVQQAGNLKETSQIHQLDVADFDSAAGAPHKVLDDKSVLLVDDPPDKDIYTIKVQTKLANITAFQLEALTHPTLPGSGPGRGDPQRPNFVLNTFALTAAPASDRDAAKPVKFKSAKAGFAQKNYDVAGAIDEDVKTAWAINPQFGKSHQATFECDRPVGFAAGTTLTFTLVQEYGGGRTIGRLRLSAVTGNPQAKPLPPDIVSILQMPKAKRSAAQAKRLLDFRLEQDEVLTDLKGRQVELDQKLKALSPATSLAMQELAQPRMTAVFRRGNYTDLAAAVTPGTPAVLHAFKANDGSTPNRLDLARWLVDRDNPLAARVTVNRWWAELFGRGIVSTVEDFGVKGESPTHPELLDWLAVEFMEQGWSMKKLMRTVVTSATYRQSSRLTPELRLKDDQNRLYARGPRFRLDAEGIRDNALSAAGLLSRKQFGPPIRPYQPDGLWNKIGGDRVEYLVSPGEDRYRRGIYVVWKRGAPYPSFVNFDATARLACTVKRSRSNTPLQALTLLNDPVYVEATTALARRVLTESASTGVNERVRHAFRLCLVRQPSNNEVATLRRLYEAQREAYRANPKAAAELVGSLSVPFGVTAEEFAAWHAVATVLLNLDEMITKG